MVFKIFDPLTCRRERSVNKRGEGEHVMGGKAGDKAGYSDKKSFVDAQKH